jgi:tetratricopeptide (TPR) repeat protein
MNEFKKDLNKARELKTVGKNKEALKIFEKCYMEHPDEFTYNQKNDYAWTIYKTKIAYFKNEDELFKNAEFVTQLVPQRDFNRRNSCVYTSSIFKVLNHLKDQQDFPSMISWLEKLDPNLLDEKLFRRYGRFNKSHKELYFDWSSKAYYRNMDYEKCIEVSKTALNTLERFLDDGDAWFKWRIAKSLIELGRPKEALDYYLQVIEIKHDWYMYRDIAEIYYNMGKYWISLDYICPAILSSEPNRTKVNLYYLCYKIFKKPYPEMAMKHAELFYLLKKEEGNAMPYEIEQLDIDEARLNRRDLEREIKNLWTQYKFKGQKLHHGTVISFNQGQNFGFIKSEDDEDIFFHKSQFKSGTVHIGQIVSFYTEESFDKSKNRKSLKAVNVRGE